VVMTRMTSCPACGAMISANASTCPRCGAVFTRTHVAPVGLAIMLAIAVLYALFQALFVNARRLQTAGQGCEWALSC
jgi:uncharacterized paraquat-inducible protein A